MQDMTSAICSTVGIGETGTLIDSRDNQPYNIAKLADGKCWMTTNLNLAGGTTLTSDNTDIPNGYTLPTANNFQSGNRLPASTTVGFNDNTKAFVYNSNSTTCGNNSPCYSYYSWTAATLGSGLSISTENTDAPYSICPKGWRLPTTGSNTNGDWKRGDFYRLATNYGIDLSSDAYDNNSNAFYNNAGPGTIPNFVLAGRYYGNSFHDGSEGLYWSSTSGGDTSSARGFNFRSSTTSVSIGTTRYCGFSIRCLLK